MSFNFGGSKSKSNASNQGTDFSRQLALVHQKTQRTANKQAEAIKKVQKDNRGMKRDNLRLQAKVNAIDSDKNELIALRAEVNALKTDQADMLVVKEQLARLTALIAGSEMVAVK
jgi:succinate dehydrogenase/fumarate reductase flavoprotein subunit